MDKCKCSLALIAMIGIPCSGKTKFISDFTSIATMNVIPFEADKYEAISNSTQIFSPEKWKKAQKLFIYDIEKSIKCNISNLQASVIFIDDNNQWKSMRKRYATLCIKYHIGYGTIYMNTEISLAIKNNSDRKKEIRVPDTEIMKLYKIIKDSDLIDVFQIRNYIATISYDMTKVTQYIYDCILHPLEDIIAITEVKKEKDREITLQNYKHCAEIELRKIIGSKIKGVSHDKEIVKSIQLLKEHASSSIKKASNQEQCNAILVILSEQLNKYK